MLRAVHVLIIVLGTGQASASPDHDPRSEGKTSIDDTSTPTPTSSTSLRSTDVDDSDYFELRLGVSLRTTDVGSWQAHDHRGRTVTVRRGPRQLEPYVRLFAGGHPPIVTRQTPPSAIFDETDGSHPPVVQLGSLLELHLHPARSTRTRRSSAAVRWPARRARWISRAERPRHSKSTRGHGATRRTSPACSGTSIDSPARSAMVAKRLAQPDRVLAAGSGQLCRVDGRDQPPGGRGESSGRRRQDDPRRVFQIV